MYRRQRSRGKLSPPKPQQSNFGSTSRISQIHAIQIFLTPLPLSLPFSPPLQLLPIMITSPHVALKIAHIIHISYFLGRSRSGPDIHVAKFEITSVPNDILVAKFQEVYVASFKKMPFYGIKDNPHLQNGLH